MAIYKALVAALLVSFVVFHVVQADQMMETNGIARSLLQTIDCGAACVVRCSKASRQKVCIRACGTCCERCNCVPPGTSGNTEACPCYANLKTHGGKPKCP